MKLFIYIFVALSAILSTADGVTIFDDFKSVNGWSVPVFQFGQSGYGGGRIHISDGLTLWRDPVAGFKFYAVFAEKTYNVVFEPNTWVHFRYKLGQRLIGADLYATVYVNGVAIAQLGVNGEQLWKRFDYCVPADVDNEIFWGSNIIYGYLNQVNDFRVALPNGIDSVRWNDGWTLFSIKYEDKGGDDRRVRIFVDGREIIYRCLDEFYPNGIIDNNVVSSYSLPTGSCSLKIQFGVTGDGNLYSDTSEHNGWGFNCYHAFADNTPAVPHAWTPSLAVKQASYMYWDYLLINTASDAYLSQVRQLILEGRLKVSTAIFTEQLIWQDAEKLFSLWVLNDEVNKIRAHPLGSPSFTPALIEKYSEFFSTATNPFPGSTVEYNNWTVVNGAAYVQSGVLNLVNSSGGDENIYGTVPNNWSALKITAKVGSQTDGVSAGSYAVGIVFGDVCAIFHPAYTGGSFRFQKLDGTALSGNIDMGFTPAKGVFHPMEVIAEKYNGQWYIKVTVKNGSGSEVFTNMITLSDTYVNGLTKIGVIRTGTGGGNGIFDDLIVTERPAACLKNLRADINGDCIVDMQDLLTLVSEWLNGG
ncbi:MAG: hypothetical protein ACYC54_13100 [Sedimentisphaerales bacterium]